jgi:hypothetical protein
MSDGVSNNGDRSAPAGPRLHRWVRVLTVVNAVVLVVALVLPLVRTSVGASTGLWHDCVVDPATGTGSAGWSWPVLLTLVPFALGILLGAWGRSAFAYEDGGHTAASRGAMTLLVISLVGAAWITVLWLVPTTTCIT